MRLPRAAGVALERRHMSVSARSVWSGEGAIWVCNFEKNCTADGIDMCT
jgi:hypothetical protein